MLNIFFISFKTNKNIINYISYKEFIKMFIKDVIDDVMGWTNLVRI